MLTEFRTLSNAYIGRDLTAAGIISAGGVIYAGEGNTNSNLWEEAYNTVTETLVPEVATINNYVDALYLHLIQNFERNIVATSSTIEDFVATEWSAYIGLVHGSTITLSAANKVYLLGDSDGSSSTNYTEVNLKPNFLFYRSNIGNYTVINSFPLSAMKSSKYVLQVEDTNTNDVYYGEVNVVANNTLAIASEYSSNYTTQLPFIEFGAALLNQRVCLSAVSLNGHTMSNFIIKGNRTNFF